ncbi:MAG TPA: hypothetical protein VF439_03410 [Candidatus Paceibacterota bacterium]|jgi:hypothetical protein
MLKLIFWIIVLVLALSFFGISIRSIVESPVGQQNVQFLWDLIVSGWNSIVHLAHP